MYRRTGLYPSLGCYVFDALGRRFEKHRLDKDSQPYNRTRFMFDGLRMIEGIKLTQRKSCTYIVTPTAMNRWREETEMLIKNSTSTTSIPM